ncbi:V-type ATP synthase subunit E [Aeropyrum pernix K1]|uniref:A-type ATP synthase subunit E n=1 Tax=Aeropyrum pernix (strain ATCC 700893 / DSM 11879 / JCM 9820 / NBRC 100138 / K1) TaxID=272557 RepID=AATE_AERPE|nr:V-type ATP synthase subunit E [Aeropyrum pernix]Q9YF31.2 RecName: Full=V-type ATP synthase subunit E; AltName: Full=V-ATPase subunit E [Aeropyrum pernix K1]BAA79365.2 V-type ATP synthase subunit E [Aeropyrum pernix K1]
MAKVQGDPRRFADTVLEKPFKEALARVEEAREAGLKLVEEAYKSALSAARKRLESRVEEARERLQGLKSKADLEVRTEAERVKDELVSRLIEEALAEFRRRKAGMESYRQYLERVLGSAAGESGGSVAKVLCAPEDEEIVREVLGKLGLDGVSVEAVEGIYGGVVVELAEGARLDYTVNNIIAAEEPRLRRAVKRALFEA